MSKRYYIKDIERILKVGRTTLFYWEASGKIPKARRDRMSNFRFWFEGDIKKLRRITGR